MAPLRFFVVDARSQEDSDETNSSNNTNSKNTKLPTPDKMIKHRSDVELTLGTVWEVLRKWEEVPIGSKERAAVCEDVRVKMNEMTDVISFGVMVVSETGLREWPLPFLVVKESVVSHQMTLKIYSNYSGD